MIGSDLGLVVVAPRGTGGPPLLLDFVHDRYGRGGETATTFTTLSGTSFVRTGAGTAFASAGVVTAFATGAPRITDRGLLLEVAATNLSQYSWDTANAAWVASGGSKTSGQADPMGSANACLFAANASVVSHRLFAPQATAAAGVKTVSALIKAGTTDRVQLFLNTAAYSGLAYANFHLNGTGAISASGGTLADLGISALGGGFYRIWVAAVSNATSNGGPCLSPLTTGSEGRDPAMASPGSIQVVGAQVETGAVPTAPIVTTSGSVTRGADAASVVVPAGCTTYSATYGAAGAVVSGPVTAGATFDLVTGRPWVGVGNELKRLEMA